MLSNQFRTISIHPLFIALCFFSAGVYAQTACSQLALSMMLLVALCILCLLQKKFISLQKIMYACAFFAGNYAYNAQLTNHNHFFTTIDEQQPYSLTGVIASIQDLQFKRYSRYCILKNVTLYQNKSNTIVHENFCMGFYSNNLNDFCIDDTISLQGIKFKNPHASYQHYLIKEGLIATSFLQNECQPYLVSRPLFSFKRWIFNKKNELLYSLKNKMNASSFTFFSSLFLGNKTNSFHYEKLKDHFKRWGLSHYLARSGLHLILFIALWQFLLRFIPLAFIIKHLILSCIVVLYFIFSWPSLPFIRSCITYFVYFIYILCNKQIDSLHILTLVTWLILLSNPVQLFSLDFQLSFGLTFALIWFSRLQRVQTKNRTTSHKINPITNLEFIQKH